MTTYTWNTNQSEVWNTATAWANDGTLGTAAIPNSATADVFIDYPVVAAGTAYAITIPSGTVEEVDSISVNDTLPLMEGSNSYPFSAAEFILDGTLEFAPGSAGTFGGSLQNFIGVDGDANAELINVGTINAYIQVVGTLTMTGTNGVYITNDLQALGGTVVVDTAAINEYNATTHALFDGIFDAEGIPGSNFGLIGLGGSLEGLIVNIATIMGPPLNPGGWTELIFNSSASEINEWTGTAYQPIENSLTTIDGAGTVDVLGGRNYTTSNTLSVNAGTGTIAPGLLNLQAGTVSVGSLNIGGGIVQGSAEIVGNVVNNGTLIAEGGTMDLTGSLTGTGAVEFDFDDKAGTVNATGATLMVNAVSSGQTVTMNGDDTLVLNTPSAFAGTVSTGVGDTIVLSGATGTSAFVNNSTLMVMNGTAVADTIALSGNYGSIYPVVNGSTITFAAGTIQAPTISGTIPNQTVTDESTTDPFGTVAIADPNADQVETVTVTESNPANGTLSDPAGGSYNATTGVYRVSGAPATVTADLDALVFAPTAGQVAAGGTVTTEFTISVVDTILQTATDDTTSVAATAAGPAISGTVADQAVTDETTVDPFSGVTIASAAGTDTLTVTLSNLANGSLGNLGNGSYDATTGVYTETGTAATLTTDLDALVFTPTAGEVAIGDTVTTGFTIAVSDATMSTATDSSTSVVATAVQPPTRNFTITDTTTGTTISTMGTVYSGPVAGLTSEFITATSDSLAVTATQANVFIHTGSGNDAIDVSQVNGNNVLDGSTGSNFLVGGTGDDTFFLDDRGLSADVFSTVVNFHSGDDATIWGITPTDFTMNTYNNQGAAGYTGLDFSFTAPGSPDANLVLTGFSTADLTDGKLTVTYGTTATVDGVAGSTYMLIHAN